MIVVVEDGGGRVAGHVDVGPAVFVAVEGGDGEAVVAGGFGEAALDRDIFELAVAEVVIEHVRRPLEPARTAHDGHALPHAAGSLAGLGHVLDVEVDVVGDGDVELAVAIVVDEGAAGAPLLAGAGDAGLFGDFAESAVALVVVEAVLAVAGYVEVGQAVVVVVADAGALAPAGVGEPGFRGHVGKGAVVVVVEEMAGGCRAGRSCLGVQISAVDEKDVGVAVTVVVEDGNAGACRLQNVTFGGYSAINIQHLDTGLRRHVFEPCGRGMNGAGGIRFGYLLRGGAESEKNRVNANYERFRTTFV